MQFNVLLTSETRECNSSTRTVVASSSTLYTLKINVALFTALHGMQARSSDENSLCPFVCPSFTRVHCDKTVERSVQIFIPHERTFSYSFMKKNGWWGRPILPEMLGQLTPVGAK